MGRNDSGEAGSDGSAGSGRDAIHALNNRLFSIRMSASALADSPEIRRDSRLSSLVEAIIRAAIEAGDAAAALRPNPQRESEESARDE